MFKLSSLMILATVISFVSCGNKETTKQNTKQGSSTTVSEEKAPDQLKPGLREKEQALGFDRKNYSSEIIKIITETKGGLVKKSYTEAFKSFYFDLSKIVDLYINDQAVIKVKLLEGVNEKGENILAENTLNKMPSMELFSTNTSFEIYTTQKLSELTNSKLIFEYDVEYPVQAELYKIDLSQKPPYKIDLGNAVLRVELIGPSNVSVAVNENFKLSVLAMSNGKALQLESSHFSGVTSNGNFNGKHNQAKEKIDECYVYVYGPYKNEKLKIEFPLVENK